MELQSTLEQIAASNPAQIGIAVQHVESGTTVMLDADRPVPLASVVKIPVMVEAFRRIEAGQIRLEDRWSLTKAVKTVGSGVLSDLDDGLALTVQDLLTLMIIISDNTATDMLIERLEADRIQATMRELGLNAIHVRHRISEIFDDMLMPGYADADPADLAEWEEREGVRRTGFSFSPGPDNNVGTPRDLVQLMVLLLQGRAAAASSCEAMLDILLKQQINDRFPRYLAGGTKVAHKTGSFVGVRNDAGLLYLPDGTHAAFAVMTTWDYESIRTDHRAVVDTITALDQTFGRIGLAVYDAFI